MLRRCALSTLILLQSFPLSELANVDSDEASFQLDVKVMTIVFSLAIGICLIVGCAGAIYFACSYFRR
uniref:FXYD domain-containing ion transport regulator n=1 Tax=Steinernema glaseri TaxID=37863 RepID=A0A1I7YNK2_9BILA